MSLTILTIKWSPIKIGAANLLPLYAAAGIPEVWIVNLPEKQLEQYTEPASEGYSSIRIYRAGDRIEQDWIGVLEMGRLFGAS